MSADWPLARIADIASNIAIGPFGSRMKSDCYVPSGVPVIRGTNLTGGKSFSGNWVFISDPMADQLGNCCVSAGDLVFPHRGSIGEVGIVTDDFPRYVMSSSLMKLTCNRAKADPVYVYYFFKSQQGKHELLKNASQVGTPGIGQPLTSLKGIEIPLPPVPVQRDIARILGDLDDKIELNRQINQTLEQIAQTLFKCWFVDFEPVKAKIEAKAAGCDPERAAMCAISGKLEPELDQLPPEQRQQLAATAALFPDALVESELGLIPLGWEWTAFGRVIELFDSKRVPLSNRERELRKGDFPYYGAAALMDHVDDYLFDGVHVLLAEDGSVITPEGKPVTQYVWGRFWVNNHAHVIKGKAPVSDEHILLFLKDTNISPYINGAVQLKLNQKNMNSIPFLKANDVVLEGFSKAVAPLYDSYRKISEQQATLVTLRDTLLPKLLSGELIVENQPLEATA